MSCAFCGEGDKWIKTCRTKDGFRIRVCDPCWEILSSWLVIVPGDRVVTARCEVCGRYFNPREMAVISPGGRKDAYAGTCSACSQENAGELQGRGNPEQVGQKVRPHRRGVQGSPNGNLD